MSGIGELLAVVGLASGAWTAAQKAQEFIEGIEDAPEEVAQLAKDLSALTVVLNDLRRFLEQNRHRDAAQTQYLSALSAPLTSCITESEEILKTIEPYVKAFDGDKPFKWRLRWLFNKDEILEHHKTLQHYRDTLQLTVNIANFSYTNENINDLSNRIDKLAYEVANRGSPSAPLPPTKHDVILQDFLSYTAETVIGAPTRSASEMPRRSSKPTNTAATNVPHPPATVSTPGGSTSTVHAPPAAPTPPNATYSQPQPQPASSAPRPPYPDSSPQPNYVPQPAPQPTYQPTYQPDYTRRSSIANTSPLPSPYPPPPLPPQSHRPPTTIHTPPPPQTSSLVVALFRYRPPLPHLLPLRPGDLLTVKGRTSNSTWLYGHALPTSNLLSEVVEGYFPASHVASAIRFEAQAKHDFFTTDKECLAFIKGEKVTVTYSTGSVWDWWVGYTVDGKRGRFPAKLLRGRGDEMGRRRKKKDAVERARGIGADEEEGSSWDDTSGSDYFGSPVGGAGRRRESVQSGMSGRKRDSGGGTGGLSDLLKVPGFGSSRRARSAER